MTLAGYLTLPPERRPALFKTLGGRRLWSCAQRDRVRVSGYHGPWKEVVRVSHIDRHGRRTKCFPASTIILPVAAPPVASM